MRKRSGPSTWISARGADEARRGAWFLRLSRGSAALWMPLAVMVGFLVLSTVCRAAGQPCGGIGGLPLCGMGEFCKTDLGECCCDFVGICTVKAEICAEIFDPVCGCDGESYGNACQADAAGVSIESTGACPLICEPECSPGTSCFSGQGVLVPGVECTLFRADAGGEFVVESGFLPVGQRVTVEGCLDSNCVTICLQSNGCIDGTVTPAPEPAAGMLGGVAVLVIALMRRSCREIVRLRRA